MVIKNRNLYRITRLILLKLPNLLKFFAKFRSPLKRLLIIKTDAIGDYILFRNFIEEVKVSEKFRGHQIDLLGNRLWEEIALKYDRHFIGNFIFINPDDLYEAPLKTLKLGLKLFRNNYQVVLQPSYSRTLITDGLAGLTAAKEIIGFEGDNERIRSRYKFQTDNFYTRGLQMPVNIHFEFERSKFFFETVLNELLSIKSPFINIEQKNRSGIIIFPGAGVKKRRWETEKFLSLIKLILRHSAGPVFLAGGPAELSACSYIEKNLPFGSIDNLTGKTTLNELIDIIGNSNLVISNETSAVHIAAATNTKSVCILGGGHFGRFAPYPAYMENAPQCFYHQMECFNCNWNCIYKTADNEPHPCVSTISLETVWKAVQPLL